MKLLDTEPINYVDVSTPLKQETIKLLKKLQLLD